MCVHAHKCAAVWGWDVWEKHKCCRRRLNNQNKFYRCPFWLCSTTRYPVCTQWSESNVCVMIQYVFICKIVLEVILCVSSRDICSWYLRTACVSGENTRHTPAGYVFSWVVFPDHAHVAPFRAVVPQPYFCKALLVILYGSLGEGVRNVLDSKTLTVKGYRWQWSETLIKQDLVRVNYFNLWWPQCVGIIPNTEILVPVVEPPWTRQDGRRHCCNPLIKQLTPLVKFSTHTWLTDWH